VGEARRKTGKGMSDRGVVGDGLNWAIADHKRPPLAWADAAAVKCGLTDVGSGTWGRSALRTEAFCNSLTFRPGFTLEMPGNPTSLVPVPAVV